MTMLTECPTRKRVVHREMRGQRWFITGGAGFIGSHFTDHLLDLLDPLVVTLFDNFSTGREWHYEQHRSDPRLQVIRGDVNHRAALRAAMVGHDVVVHLASNVGGNLDDPDADFRGGVALTREVLEAMRITGVKRILFASDASVYGEMGGVEAHEDHGPLAPCTTFGASKLAGEAMVGAYCHRYGMTGCVLRFANVVGPRQSRDLGSEFVRQLLENPGQLRIAGGSLQIKSYLHVEDLVSAMLLAQQRGDCRYQIYNVATGDSIQVAEIARMAVNTLGLNSHQVELVFGGGRGQDDRKQDGQKQDGQKLDTQRMRALGWNRARRTAEALHDSMLALLADAQVAGR